MASFQGQQFVKQFIDKVYAQYKIKVNPHDPICAEICLLEMLRDTVKQDRNEFFDMNKTELAAQAKMWREREDEFMKGFFAEVEKWQQSLGNTVSTQFNGELKNVYTEVSGAHVRRLTEVFDDQLKKIKLWSFLGLGCNVLLSFVFLVLIKYFLK